MDKIQAFINQIQTSTFTKDSIARKPFRIVVKHKTEVEIAIEEEKRRRKIKSLQRKNKRRAK